MTTILYLENLKRLWVLIQVALLERVSDFLAHSLLLYSLYYIFYKQNVKDYYTLFLREEKNDSLDLLLHNNG